MNFLYFIIIRYTKNTNCINTVYIFYNMLFFFLAENLQYAIGDYKKHMYSIIWHCNYKNAMSFGMLWYICKISFNTNS